MYGLGNNSEFRSSFSFVTSNPPSETSERMLRARSLVTAHRLFTRAYATAHSPHALVFLEHKDGVIEPSSLSALTAAQQLGGSVTGLVVGGPDQVPTVLERAKKYIHSTLPSTLRLLNQPLPLLPCQAERTIVGPAFLRSPIFFHSSGDRIPTLREATVKRFSIYSHRLCPLFFCQIPPSAHCRKARCSCRI